MNREPTIADINDLFAIMGRCALGMNQHVMEMAKRLNSEGEYERLEDLFNGFLDNSEKLLTAMQALQNQIREASKPDFMKGGEPIWKDQ